MNYVYLAKSLRFFFFTSGITFDFDSSFSSLKNVRTLFGLHMPGLNSTPFHFESLNYMPLDYYFCWYILWRKITPGHQTRRFIFLRLFKLFDFHGKSTNVFRSFGNRYLSIPSELPTFPVDSAMIFFRSNIVLIITDKTVKKKSV